MTRKAATTAPSLSLSVADAADSGAMTRIYELPGRIDASLLPADPSLDDAYRRFIAVTDALHVVHGEADTAFAALRDLQITATEENTAAALKRLNAALRGIVDEKLHLAEICPHGCDVVSSMTVDLYQFVRWILTRSARVQSGPPGQFRLELDALADHLARYDRDANTREARRR